MTSDHGCTENPMRGSEEVEGGAYMVLCVPQNSLHGSFSSGLDHLLDIVVLGLGNDRPTPGLNAGLKTGPVSREPNYLTRPH